MSRERETELPIRTKYEIYVTGRYPHKEINVEISKIAGVEINEHTTVRQIVNALLERLNNDSGDFIEDIDAAREEAKQRY